MFDKSFIEKILDRSSLALVLAGVVIFIIAAAGGLPIGSTPLVVSDAGWRIGLAILGVLLFGIGVLFLWKESSGEEKLKASSVKVFKTLPESVALLCDIAGKEKDKLVIEVIAATGGTTLSTILPSLIRSTPAQKVEISIFLVNKDAPTAAFFPAHWADEVKISIDRARQEWSTNPAAKITAFNIYCYDFLPTMHGIMLNRKHVVFGFFRWQLVAGRHQLSGAETSHRYFSSEKHPDAQFILDTFSDWVENMPCQKIYSLPMATQRT